MLTTEVYGLEYERSLMHYDGDASRILNMHSSSSNFLLILIFFSGIEILLKVRMIEISLIFSTYFFQDVALAFSRRCN